MDCQQAVVLEGGDERLNPAVEGAMGNEQQGLTDELADSCDRLLRIPQAGRADSLNLAVATGVMTDVWRHPSRRTGFEMWSSITGPVKAASASWMAQA